MRVIANRAAASHEWEGMTIGELTETSLPLHASAVAIDIPAGVRHPLARSRKCEAYYYCVRGSVEFEVDGTQAVLHPGDLVAVETNEWYRYRALEEAALLCFNVPPYDPSSYEFRNSEP